MRGTSLALPEIEKVHCEREEHLWLFQKSKAVLLVVYLYRLNYKKSHERLKIEVILK
jgi:hypothetical protein